MAWYRAGTVGATNGSKNITGASTAWVNNVQPGDAFIGPDGAYYEVDVVGGNGALTLVENYAGTTVPSGGAYKIIPTQGRVRDMAAAVLQLINDYSAVESALTVSGGNVGLDITPTERLHVNGNLRLPNNAAIKIDNASGVAREVLTIGVDNNVYAGQVSAPTGASLFLYGQQFVFTGAAERMRIDNAGRLLIGRNVGNVTALKFALEGRMESCVLGSHAYSYGAATGANAFVINDSSSGAEVERLRIDASGNVGIGEASLGARLHATGSIAISQDAGVQRLLIGNRNSGGANLPAMVQGVNGALEFGAGNTWTGNGGTMTVGFRVRGTYVELSSLAADPSGAGAGAIYLNSTTGKFRGHTGAGWVDLH